MPTLRQAGHRAALPACSALAVLFAVRTPGLAAPAAAAKPAAAPTAVSSGYRLAASAISLPGDSGWDYLAVDAGGRRLYVSHGDRVAVIDADTLTPVAEIAGLTGVHGIALAPELQRGFISNGKS